MKLKKSLYILLVFFCLGCGTPVPAPTTINIISPPSDCQKTFYKYSVDHHTNECIRHGTNGDSLTKCTKELKELIELCTKWW